MSESKSDALTNLANLQLLLATCRGNDPLISAVTVRYLHHADPQAKFNGGEYRIRTDLNTRIASAVTTPSSPIPQITILKHTNTKLFRPGLYVYAS